MAKAKKLLIPPKLYREWDEEKNQLPLAETKITSNSKSFWVCEKCSYKWSANIAVRRYSGSGCPSCAGQVPTPDNNLEALHPDLLKDWDWDKNVSLPSLYTPKSSRKVHWVCRECNYPWVTGVKHRANGGGCPACAGQVATDKDNFSLSNPDIAAEWHPADENKPQMFKSKSDYKAHWLCKKCGYSWLACIKDRVRGTGCPACSGNVVTDKNRLTVLRPDLVKEWDYTKNKMAPDTYSVGSSKKVFWKCFTCHHEWKATIAHRSGGTDCPACAGTAVTASNNLAVSYPELTLDWGNLNRRPPNTYTCTSGYRAHWLCSACGYSWRTAIAHRTSGQSCPSCIGKIPSKTNNLSLGHPELVEEWSSLNAKSPEKFLKRSNKKVIWVCKKCKKTWSASINSRTGLKSGCPHCAQSGYRPSKPGWLYVQEITYPSIAFIKFGITNRDPIKRLKQQAKSSKLRHRLVVQFSFADGVRPLTLERMIKDHFKQHINVAAAHGLKFDGSTETVPVTCLDELLFKIKEFYGNQEGQEG